MAGVLGNLNKDRQQALGQFGQLAGLETQRQNQNDAIQKQETNKRNAGLMGGVTTAAVGVATANPIAIGLGGLQIIGSLF